MEDKIINLENILAEYMSKNLQSFGKSKEASDAVAKMSVGSGSSRYIVEAMKEACRQTLELAAENGNLKIYRENMYNPNDNEMLIENEYNYGEWNSNGADYHVDVTINNQSILDTINQLK